MIEFDSGGKSSLVNRKAQSQGMHTPTPSHFKILQRIKAKKCVGKVTAKVTWFRKCYGRKGLIPRNRHVGFEKVTFNCSKVVAKVKG